MMLINARKTMEIWAMDLEKVVKAATRLIHKIRNSAKNSLFFFNIINICFWFKDFDIDYPT